MVHAYSLTINRNTKMFGLKKSNSPIVNALVIIGIGALVVAAVALVVILVLAWWVSHTHT